MTFQETNSALYDLHADPQPKQPIEAPHIEDKLDNATTDLMHKADAPKELFTQLRLGSNRGNSEK